MDVLGDDSHNVLRWGLSSLGIGLSEPHLVANEEVMLV